jgi:hypothetical protein
MAIGVEQAAIRTAIAGALVEYGSENGRTNDALFAMRQANPRNDAQDIGKSLRDLVS